MSNARTLIQCWLLAVASCFSTAGFSQDTDFDQAKSALLSKQYSLAHDLLLPLAEGGNSDAQILLATLYSRGQGVDRDFVKARHWLEESAWKRDGKALFELAKLYELGRGAPQDLSRARELYVESESVGYTRAAEAAQRVSRKLDVADSGDATPLFELIKKDRTNELAIVLESNPEVANQKGTEGQLPLIFSIRYGSVPTTELLLAHGADPDSVDWRGVSALGLAAEMNSAERISLLLRFGADLNRVDSRGNTPLHHAVMAKNSVCVDLILNAGAEASLLNKDGKTPLDLVAGDMVEMRVSLTRAGGRSAKTLPPTAAKKALSGKAGRTRESVVADKDHPFQGWPSLNQAAWRGRADEVRALIEGGAELESLDTGGFTPLARAAWQGHTAIIELLLATKQVNILNTDIHKAPLFLAIKYDHAEVARLLLNATDETELFSGVTSEYFSQAIENGNEALAIRLLSLHEIKLSGKERGEMLINAVKRKLGGLAVLLLDQGADTANQDEGGRTALWWAVDAGSPQLVSDMLEHSFDPEVPDNDGNTPVHMAALRGSIDTLKLIAHRRVNLNVENHSGTTPLMLAAHSGHVQMVEWLIDHGVDIRHRDHSSYTGLMLAAQADQLEVVKVLIRAGADPRRRNSEGLNALAIARNANAKSVVDFLASRM